MLGAMSVAMALLVLASAAYACTVFKGRLTADQANNANSASSQTVIGRAGTGGGSGVSLMKWCDPSNNSSTTYDPPVNMKVDEQGASIRVKLDPETTQCLYEGSNKNQLGTYTVGYKHGHMPPGGGTSSVHNCHLSSNTLIGTLAVDSNGSSAATTFTYTPSSLGDHSLCIYHPTALDSIAINVNSDTNTTN
ncbi:MAG: hypothetical protein LC798_08380 [Chloroflexi bacterium]|nr:hypothetical protein [Chloroflexota bacterium]